MLQKLLASRNPDDLRAANRLIREMVRRDDKRMQKLQKRLDELELVQNNVKLLNELLSHYKSDSGEQERLLIDVSVCEFLLSLLPLIKRCPSVIIQLTYVIHFDILPLYFYKGRICDVLVYMYTYNAHSYL